MLACLLEVTFSPLGSGEIPQCPGAAPTLAVGLGDRHALLADRHGPLAVAESARHETIAALRRAITETQTKSKRLVGNLKLADDVDQEFIRDITERGAELRSQREELERQLAQAEDEVHRAPNPTLAA